MAYGLLAETVTFQSSETAMAAPVSFSFNRGADNGLKH